MPVRFAEITYTDDKFEAIVPIEDVKEKKQDKTCIRPVDCTDFFENQKYYVKFYYCGIKGKKCEEDHEHDFQYHKAFIRSLLGKYKILKNYIKSCKP